MRASALGEGSEASGDSSTAVGQRSVADSFHATAVGQRADALAEDATALGAHTTAAFTNSTAIGARTVTTRADQVAIGTLSNTYTMSGLTSAASAAAQSGPTELVTSDASGNLATDGGRLFKTVDENTEGIAMAMAMANPDLVGGESFGLMINFGEFSGESAIAFSAMGVVARNVLGPNSGRISVGASVGFGLGEGEVGGRIGAQLTF